MNMELSLSAKHVSVAAITNNLLPIKDPKFQFQVPRVTFRISSKKSNLQDFQTYAKPSRLLPASEVKIFSESSPEKILSSISVDGSLSLYKANLRTSNVYGSALTDINAGILICLIDENNDSILQRISASSMKGHVTESEDFASSDILHFQRGSVDEVTFSGPKLGKIKAMWIGLESGQWRLGGVNLTVISLDQTSKEETGEKETQYMGFQYNLEAEDILLGEGSESSMIELKPYRITELSGVDPFTIFQKDLLQYPSLENRVVSNEESMKEYADLKISLLLYDAMLIFLGTSIADFSSGDGAAFSFLFGGACGFLYLLLLQRSVDGLPTPASSPTTEGNFGQMFKGFKSPVTGLALAIGFVVLALKYGSSDVSLELTPKDLIVGMMGFLACKVSVVLAAFKSMPLGPKANE